MKFVYEQLFRSTDQHGRLGNRPFDAPNCFMTYLRNHSMKFGLEVCNCLWIIGITLIFTAHQRNGLMVLNRSFLMANSYHNFC